MVVDEGKILARKSARDSASEIIQLLEWPDGYGADFAEAFLEALRSKLPKRRTTEPTPEKPQPIARLGATVMPFGAHQGKSFDEVPLEYLDWLCGTQESFHQALKAYLKHPELISRRGV